MNRSVRVCLPWLLPLAVVGSACQSGGSKIGTTVVPVEPEVEVPTPPTLQLTVEPASVVAGEPVSWSLALVFEDGRIEPVQGSLASDREELTAIAADQVEPHIAGSHSLTAAATFADMNLTATSSLEVGVGAPASLDLVLSDEAFAAGGSVGWTVEAWDSFGNTADASAVVPDVFDAPLLLSGATISGTTPGRYVVSAVLDGLLDEEPLVVTAGPAAEVVLSLSDTDLELYDTTSASVDIWDAYGNSVDAPWTLSVMGTDVLPEDFGLSWNNITFYSEGAYTVRVDVDGTGLYDEVGPLLIDSTGPVIDILSPDHGTWQEGLSTTVSGTVYDPHTGVASLEVDGTPVSVASDGSFSQDVELVFGTNVVSTIAVDADGNTSNDARAVLAGDFLPWGDPVSDGFLVRLNDGPGGLDTLETIGEELVATVDLDALIPSPVFSDSERTCVTVWPFGTRCFTWYALTLYVRNPSFGSVDFEIDPYGTGRLDLYFTVYDLDLDWVANATVAEIDYNGSGAITADSVEVYMRTSPSVDASGNISLGLSTVTTTTSNFYFDWDSWLYDALDFFGIDASISGLIAGYIEDAVESTARTQAPALLESALQDLEIGFDFDLNGVLCSIDAIPERISIDLRGVVLALKTYVEPAVWTKSSAIPGSLYADYSMPGILFSPNAHLGVNIDFLNQFLTAAWGGGLLDMELTGDALGVDTSALAFLLPGLTDLTITTEALLPPVIVPDGTAALLELQMGDLLLTLYNGDALPGNEVIQVYVHAFVEMDVDASADGSSLVPVLGAMDLEFDVVVPESNTMGAADTEALLGLVVPLLLPTLTDALSEIPIPDIQGFGLTGVTVTTQGAEDGLVTLGGSLVTR